MYNWFCRRQKKLGKVDKGSPAKPNGRAARPLPNGGHVGGPPQPGVMTYGELSDPSTGTFMGLFEI